MYRRKVISRKFLKSWFFPVFKVKEENIYSGSFSQRHGSADPDPYQNVPNTAVFFTSGLVHV